MEPTTISAPRTSGSKEGRFVRKMPCLWTVRSDLGKKRGWPVRGRLNQKGAGPRADRSPSNFPVQVSSSSHHSCSRDPPLSERKVSFPEQEQRRNKPPPVLAHRIGPVSKIQNPQAGLESGKPGLPVQKTGRQLSSPMDGSRRDYSKAPNVPHSPATQCGF